jgi:hypothetical protein
MLRRVDIYTAIGIAILAVLLIVLLLYLPNLPLQVYGTTTPSEIFETLGITAPRYSQLLTKEVHNPTLICPDGLGTLHYITYTDKAGNTVDIYCMHNEWLAEETDRQYIGYYNNQVVIGQCPYNVGLNTYTIMTDKSGIINSTFWRSVTPDGSGKSVEYRLEFNNN